MEGNLPGKLLQEVIPAPRETGYNPYDQLEGYIQTGDASHITRTGDARIPYPRSIATALRNTSIR